MKLPTIIHYHIDKIKNLDYTNAKRYMAKHFTHIGDGAESECYSRKGFDYVIKLYISYHEDGRKDTNPNETYFLSHVHLQFENFAVIVQHKIESYGGLRKIPDKLHERVRKFQQLVIQKFPQFDLHNGNIGIFRGRLFYYDW